MTPFTFFPGHPGADYRKTNVLFIVAVLLLWGLGIFTLIISTTEKAELLLHDKYYFVVRQLMWSAIGFAGLLFFALMPMKVIRKCLPLFVIGILVLCIITIIPGIGSEKKGGARWIRIGSFATIQPSEFAKFAVVLFLANLFDKQKVSSESGQLNFIYPLTGLLIFVLSIFLQNDFSTGFFVFVVGCLMFFVSGASMSWFIPLVLLAVPATFMMIAIKPYRIDRVMSFFNREAFMDDSWYQALRSQRAISSGGIWGTGLGTGMSNVAGIPEVQSDFVFAGWVNSMGFVGVVAYQVVLFVFAFQGYVVSFTSKSRFASYGAFGCVSIIFLQSLINVGVVSGALPTTGIPQPFFSSGGSSLVATMIMCGFIINASHCKTDEESVEYESKEDESVKNKIWNF